MQKATNKIIFYILGTIIVLGFCIWGINKIWPTTDFEYDSSTVKLGSLASDELEVIASEPVWEPTHISTPEAVKAAYMTSWVASTREWRANLVKMVEETELNSFVIDVKDYAGTISFEVSDPDLKDAEEIRINDVKDFLALLHEKGIYAIARISVFQDSHLVKERVDLAVKTKSGAVWEDYKGISWIDPCAEEYWDYIVKVARETENVGFDELNFDYIRFPSDGNMKDIAYDFCNAEIPKAESLENFFRYLSENLSDLRQKGIKLSADLFGMVTVNTDDLNIGQVLERAVPYFDYIAPMVYPSHYPKGYKGYSKPATKPYEIIKHGMDVAIERLVNNQLGLEPYSTSTPAFRDESGKILPEFELAASKLRPWLQDFDLGATYDESMVRAEKQAVYDSGLTSWMLWDPANKYTRSALD
jgi:hypothetical protein